MSHRTVDPAPRVVETLSEDDLAQIAREVSGVREVRRELQRRGDA